MPVPGAFAGQYFSATATEFATANTSEFSADLLVTNSAGGSPGGFTGPFVLSGAGFSFSFLLATNQSYTVQTTTHLAQAQWENLTNFFATTSPVRIGDTNPPSAARYYRLVTP